MSNDELLINELEQAVYNLHELEPGSEEYKRQAQVVMIFNTMIREREKAADEFDEKNSKEAKKERRIERIERFVLPCVSNIAAILWITCWEAAGNFIKTKAFNLVGKVNANEKFKASK